MDERTLLSPLAKVVAALPNASITVSMPLLQPQAEDAKYHFTPPKGPPYQLTVRSPDGFTIQRHLTQVYEVLHARATPTISKNVEFPMMRRLFGFDKRPLQDVLDYERAYWLDKLANDPDNIVPLKSEILPVSWYVQSRCEFLC